MQSPSSINTYFQCPRKYFYIYKLRMPTSPSIHLVRGSIAHLVLEKLYTIVPEVISDNYKENLKLIIEELLKKYWKESEEELQQLELTKQEINMYLEETKNMLLNYLEQYIKKLDKEITEKNLNFVEAFNKLKPETEKEYLSWEHYVKGFIDVIENYEGKIRLMDYKTSKKPVLTDAYKLQLAIYALLYKTKHDKKPDEVGIYFLRDGETTIKVTDDLIKEAEFKIEQIHASTESDDIKDYKKNQTPLCKWHSGQCDFYDYCFKNKKIPEEPLPKRTYTPSNN